MSLKIPVLMGLLLSFNAANAMDGVFDRSAEIDQYIAQLNSKTTQDELVPTARAIHISGISDERLAKAIADRLLHDLPKLDTQFGAWMVRALASTGDPIAKDALVQVRNQTRLSRIKTECKEQIGEVDWFRRRNEVMASRRNYSEGDNMRVAQLLNLLQSDDLSFKQNATYRMNWDKTLDARLMTEIALQLQSFIDNGGVIHSEEELLVISDYAKMLGYSHDQQYGDLLRRLTVSSSNLKLKRAAGKALDNLHGA